MLLLSVKVNSQEVYQQTTIELNESLDNSMSYLCQATSSIELLPGFDYNPSTNNKMLLGIDRYSVYPPIEGIYGGNLNSNDEGVVGSVPGIINVASTGAATYSVDIQLPQALGGMTPELAIAYNSQSSDGLLGWSWELLGLSSIERIGQTEYHDGNVTNVDFVNDRYMLDGQRLMPIGNGEYKTEIDNFDKIVSYGGTRTSPNYFVVWKSDGTIWEYGITEDSKVEPQGKGNVVLKWLLNRILDRNGNAIVYNYYENNSTGESYIKSIEYASNDKANVKPAYSVIFKYDKKKNPKFGYVGGSLVSHANILNAIEVYNNYSGKKIIEYSLKYYAPGVYDKNYYLHYRLNSIQLTIDGKKVNPTRVVWNSKEKWATENSCGFKKYEVNKKIFNRVTFVGDFNGDGFSDVLLLPYKIQNTYAADVVGEVYLNNGNGTFAERPLTKIMFNKNLEWVYVCDVNGDGVDDIVPYEIHYDNSGNFDVSRFSIIVMENGGFVKKKTFVYKKPLVLLPGNHVDKNNNGFVLIEQYDGNKNKSLAKYVYLRKEEYVVEDIQNSNAINGKNISCMSMDISGDGVAELLALEEGGYRVYRMRKSGNLSLEPYCSGYGMTKDIYTFPNDYNGDGKIDMLYYDPVGWWNIVISTGTGFTNPMQCTRNSLLQNVRLSTKDKYVYSLREMQKPRITIRTADFDGDGTADVGVFHNDAGNYYLEIGFLPFVESQSSYNFSYYRRYHMPINYTHQTIQLGRFLAQENISILSGLPSNPVSTSKAFLVALCPNSAYYSVENIIDGMGNSTELLYDYLVHDGKNEDAFYKCSGEVDANKVERESVPILALKEIKTYNVNDKPIIKRYSYKNALIHKRGRGFLGFESVVVRNYVDNNLISKQQQDYNMMHMDRCCMPLLVADFSFFGENQLVKEHYFEYKKYTCSLNNKVVVPMLMQESETIHNVDRRGEVIKYIMTDRTYRSDISSASSYNKIICLRSTKKGYNNTVLTDLEESQYIEEMFVTYENDIANWIINRPKEISKSVRDKENDYVGDIRTIEYDKVNPMNVVKETMIPNVYADEKDSLTLVVRYKYDKVGNMVEQTMSSPSLKADKTIKSEYGEAYRYRYKTKSIDEIGREIICRYNDNFGILTSTVDCNGLVTRMETEPFGVKSVVTTPDGMKSVNVLRWSENSKYAPKKSSYYSWEKSTGKAEMMVFYHKTGAELRRVTFDINGKAIIVDKMYDDNGNLKQESYPYYESDDKLFVSNTYDGYNRMVESVYPDGRITTRTYDGNDVQIESYTKDALKRYKKESYNVMGWMTSVVDNGGNEVKYEYYSDGMLKSAQIGGKGNTKVLVTYDNRRNKTSVQDPNYGKISYTNDALGNIKRIVNAQDVIEMEYDVLGRLVLRSERNIKHNTRNLVRWEYSRDKGYNGALVKVSSNKHQIEYLYDTKLRLLNTIETIKGTRYETTYSYDDANRVSTMTYPSGFTISKEYSNSGYEKVIYDANTQEMLWKTNKTNSNGFVTEYHLGNGLKTQYVYNPYNYNVENIITRKGNDVLQDLCYKYDGMCNLIYRCDLNDYNYEEFEYDGYDRLTKIILNGEVNGKMTYYSNGNISGKEVNGVKVMYDVGYAVDKPNAILRMSSDDGRIQKRISQNIKYSSFDNVVSVNENDKCLTIEYGCDNDRIFMEYTTGNKVRKKTYVGNCEYVEEDGKKRVLTYLEGPMGIFAVHVNDGQETINYIHKDNINSWNIITDQGGALLEKLSFDAWGNIRDSQDWNEDIERVDPLYDRGFTGHEHLWEFGLINMNGRLYDPLVSMMLSPDNNIQMPESSQNFNRYSYCLNNPLKYYDPTGEWVESIAFGVVGGAANLVMNAGNIDSFGEAALLFGAGFVKGFLTEFTMGQSWFLQVGVGAVSEGVLSGVNRMVSIGDGGFDFSGDDWNSVKASSYYGLGSGLVKSFMYTYMTEPTETQFGESFFESCYHKEFAHGMTSLVAHGAGCWFSGQQLLPTMKFKDVGFDLKMLGIIAKRLISSYISGLDFGEKALNNRALELKNSIMEDLRSEIPNTPDFEYECGLLGVFVEDFRLYVVGNVYEMIPGEVIKSYPKPYFEEVITFPFSYSLFKTLFFNEQ